MAYERHWTRTVKYYYHRLFPRHERSLSVAISVFLGVFIGLMPTLGIALLLTAIAAHVCKVPKGPAMLASFIAIPPTLILFFYPLGYFGVGLPLVRPRKVDFDFLARVQDVSLLTIAEVGEQLWHHAFGHLMAFLVGMTIVSLGFGLLGAGLTYVIMELKRKNRAERRSRASGAHRVTRDPL